MTEPDLNFLGRQLQRIFSELQAIRSGQDIATRNHLRSADDIGIIKNDITTLRNEVDSLRHDLRAGFDTLDARLRPLEVPPHQ
jgi:hypothetical protein